MIVNIILPADLHGHPNATVDCDIRSSFPAHCRGATATFSPSLPSGMYFADGQIKGSFPGHLYNGSHTCTGAYCAGNPVGIHIICYFSITIRGMSKGYAIILQLTYIQVDYTLVPRGSDVCPASILPFGVGDVASPGGISSETGGMLCLLGAIIVYTFLWVLILCKQNMLVDSFKYSPMWALFLNANVFACGLVIAAIPTTLCLVLGCVLAMSTVLGFVMFISLQREVFYHRLSTVHVVQLD